MNRKQRGVTAIGWICLLIPIAIVAFCAIRVSPNYMNYYRVLQALKATANEFKGDDTATVANIRLSLNKRFDTGYVDRVDVKDIVAVKDEKGLWTLTTDYEETVPLFANLHLLMVFKKTVTPD
jgi:hypothetical protein